MNKKRSFTAAETDKGKAGIGPPLPENAGHTCARTIERSIPVFKNLPKPMELASIAALIGGEKRSAVESALRLYLTAQEVLETAGSMKISTFAKRTNECLSQIHLSYFLWSGGSLDDLKRHIDEKGVMMLEEAMKQEGMPRSEETLVRYITEHLNRLNKDDKVKFSNIPELKGMLSVSNDNTVERTTDDIIAYFRHMGVNHEGLLWLRKIAAEQKSEYQKAAKPRNRKKSKKQAAK